MRGLIHTDGRHINEVERKLSTGTRRYQYSRYQFSNKSTDILGIFTNAMDLLEVTWTMANFRNVSVARREDAAFLDTFAGPKS